ncbi:cytochrome P450 [Streptomyces pinistramenti]|uniref:cytochrome P450 n=1 Tax=Streptomyces pinistramenti TaxID=2884812 RepID=UPI001D060C27|nr:cytochrome P450 [Streptomyces pinistramenti]MCB5910859.1 cytochrome P450 [Streptomyces pinistramenti]
MNATANTPSATGHDPAYAYPMERHCPYHMPAGYGPLRERRPLTRVTLYDGRSAWLVTGNAEGRALLPDPRLSCDTAHPSFPCLTEETADQQVSQLPLIGVDDPVHARQRRLVASGFGIRRIAALRPHIERAAEELTDAMLAGGNRAELVSAYALPLASEATFTLLGVPSPQRPHLGELAQRMLSLSGDGSTHQAEQTFRQLLRHLEELISTRHQAPGNGVIDDLIAQHQPLGDADTGELAMMCMVLITGGNDTTAVTLATSLHALLEHPDQLARLRSDPALVPGAVEELMRLTSVTDALLRVALADIDVAGHTIRAGEGVIFSTMLMNRDPDAWEDPDTLDVRRKAGRHVAFGYGIHQCVGQNLARVEMEIALNTLLRRIPTLRLDDERQVRSVTPHAQLGGVAELPVTWRPEGT